jgi:hypothetical protein
MPASLRRVVTVEVFTACGHSCFVIFSLSKPNNIKGQNQTQDWDEKEERYPQNKIVIKKGTDAKIACGDLKSHNDRNYQTQNKRIPKQKISP